jgi:hypothetical protein
MSALAHALDYAEHGLPVLPIKPGEKRPPMSGWQNHATTDKPTIENWFTEIGRASCRERVFDDV